MERLRYVSAVLLMSFFEKGHTQLLSLRIGLKRQMVTNLLLNVDERDKFIELLIGEEQTSSSIVATPL